MRPFLTRRNLPGADVLHHVQGRGEGRVLTDAERRHRPANIVGDQRESTCPIGADVTGRSARGDARTDGGDLAGGLVDRERAYRSGDVAVDVIHLVHEVEGTAVRVDGEKGRIWPDVEARREA